MVDIVITAASVVPTGSSNIRHGTAGATVTAGQVVYLNSSGKYLLADADDTAADEPIGIALHGASNGQPLAVCTGGDLTVGAVLTAGTDYYLSANPGGICPRADVGVGEAVVQIGIAKSTTVLPVRIINPGVTL